MSKNRWTASRTTVYNLGYHIIFCPKYRRKVLVGNVKVRLSELLNMKANELSIVIEEETIMPDHVHLFIRATPTLAPHFIVCQMKGYSSKILRQEFPSLKSRLPSLWTRSYYIESVGHISEDTIRKYIEEQEGK